MDVLEEPEEEGVLTAERVLRHAQAQGLQPVVDVRFCHRHLELCRDKGTGDFGQGIRQGPCKPPAPLAGGFTRSRKPPERCPRRV